MSVCWRTKEYQEEENHKSLQVLLLKVKEEATFPLPWVGTFSIGDYILSWTWAPPSWAVTDGVGEWNDVVCFEVRKEGSEK